MKRTTSSRLKQSLSRCKLAKTRIIFSKLRSRRIWSRTSLATYSMANQRRKFSIRSPQLYLSWVPGILSLRLKNQAPSLSTLVSISGWVQTWRCGPVKHMVSLTSLVTLEVSMDCLQRLLVCCWHPLSHLPSNRQSCQESSEFVIKLATKARGQRLTASLSLNEQQNSPLITIIRSRNLKTVYQLTSLATAVNKQKLRDTEGCWRKQKQAWPVA